MRNFLRWFLGEAANSENRIALEDSMRALVEVRVLQEVAKLREYNRYDLTEIKNEQLKYWRAFALFLVFLGIVITVIMYEYDSEVLAKRVNEAVNEEISTHLQADINNVIAAKANRYIDNALLPFKTKVDLLAAKAAQIDILNQHISTLDDTIKKANEASSDLQNKLNSSDTSIASLNQLAQNTNEQLSIIAAIVRSDNDDKVALDVLIKLANDTKSPYRGIAIEVINAITGHGNLSLPINPIPWQQIGVSDPSTLTIETLESLYPNFGRADIKEGVQQYVWNDSKFTKYKKLDFIIWTIQNDQSIASIDSAHGLLDNEAHLQQNILGNQSYVDWWNKNKDKYKAAETSSPSQVSPH